MAFPDDGPAPARAGPVPANLFVDQSINESNDGPRVVGSDRFTEAV